MNFSLLRLYLFFPLVYSSLRGDVPLAPYTAEELLQASRDQRLWRDDDWQLLLQRQLGVFGKRSLIDDPNFFLAATGKRDARAELEATVTQLAAPPRSGQRHVFDRFPARCEWLVKRLNLDRRRLPLSHSEDFARFIETLDPVAGVMIFANPCLNTPATLFGHTLLAIRSANADEPKQAIDYAPDTPENGLGLAFKGVFGLYNGVYTVTPYQQKIELYTDIAMRDIWEYELNLTREELERMLSYVWELKESSSKYFFFDKNCSFKLLFLLDVARPGHHLHRQARPWVVPLDTVKLVRREGFVRRRTYRPSLATRLRAAAAGASEAPPPVPPDLGHGSLRLRLGRGRDGGQNVTVIGFRPAYHALTDPPAGYPEGSEILFGNLELRLADGSQNLELERFDIVKVRSLSASDDFFTSRTWEMGVAVVNDWGIGDRRRTFKHLGGGVGKSWAMMANGLLYVLPRGDLRLADYGRKYSLGGGATAGFRFNPGDGWQAGVELHAIQFMAGDRFADLGVTVHLGWRLARNLNLVGKAGTRIVDHVNRDHFKLSLQAYF